MAARPRRAVDLPELAARANALVTAHGAVPREEMKAFRRHLRELRPLLEEHGLEVGSSIRRPLGAQILALSARGPLRATGLERRVSGATASETKSAVRALVDQGALVSVVRDDGPAIVTAGPAILEPDDVASLLQLVTKLQKMLKSTRGAKKAKAPRPAVLHEDVRRMLEPWTHEETSTAARTPEPRPEITPAVRSLGAQDVSDVQTLLTREIAERAGETRLPVRVPDLLRALDVPVETSKRALSDGFTRGVFVLEPESGMGRLSREDAELCPTGPMGTRLSWVRLSSRNGVGS